MTNHRTRYPKAILLFLVMFSLLACGWDWGKVRYPYPSNEGLAQWLVGWRVVYVKGLIFDDYWTIEKGEISDLKVLAVSKDEQSGIISATISFNATAQGRGVKVDNAILRYRESKTHLTLVDRVLVSYYRIGN